jgi:hypothetical protein
MSEPAEYIFQEWDSMCARANNSLRGSCPLLEDEVLVEMHKYLGGLESKLAAAEADAQRYRWLRDQHWSEDTMCVVIHPKRAVKLGESCPSGSMLDVAIDSARGVG